MRSLYDILQVSPDAEQEVIEAAYRRLARKYHPDVYSGPDAAKRMRELNDAYEVLGDPSRRATYDAKLGRPQARTGGRSPRQERPSPEAPPRPSGPLVRPEGPAPEKRVLKRNRWVVLAAGLLLPLAIAAGGGAAVGIVRSHKSESQAEVGAGSVAVVESTATPASATTPTAASARGVWDYCSKIGTSGGFAEEGQPEVAGTWVLRCYLGKPLMCDCGATCGACMPLVYNETEPEGAADWCRENPDVTFIPLAITGHSPGVYDWSCSNGEVTRTKNQIDLSAYDDLGYPRSSWELVPEPQDKEQPVPPPAPNSTFAQPPPSGGNCDESYPDVCIPWADDPHYDCAHIPFRNFRVLLPDLKGYDPDGDGIGCEWP